MPNSDTKYAVIDIGSNSIRYMEELAEGISDKELFTTRLGLGLAQTGRLAEETMKKSLGVIASLSERARSKGLVAVAYATSAMRDAENGQSFAEIIEKECGIHVDILSGEREARYAYLGAVGNADAGLLDIGGASMQIVTSAYGRSFPVGCVRGRDIAFERTGTVNCDERPKERRRALVDYIDSIVALPRIIVRDFVGVGGSLTTLAALKKELSEFSVSAVEGTVLTMEGIELIIARLTELGDAGRRELPILSERHDVILYGAYIAVRAMELIGLSEMSISCKDGMEGYLYSLRRS